jgi:DNA-binding response OmpR family regulator
MSKGTVFYLDDEEELLEFVKFVLERYGYRVIVGERWEDGYYDILENVDMIILDIMFPADEINGYEICKKIKSRENLKNIPVYMFSAKAFDEDKEEAISSGAEGFIEKPTPIDELVNLVNRVVSERRTNE